MLRPPSLCGSIIAATKPLLIVVLSSPPLCCTYLLILLPPHCCCHPSRLAGAILRLARSAVLANSNLSAALAMAGGLWTWLPPSATSGNVSLATLTPLPALLQLVMPPVSATFNVQWWLATCPLQCTTAASCAPLSAYNSHLAVMSQRAVLPLLSDRTSSQAPTVFCFSHLCCRATWLLPCQHCYWLPAHLLDAPLLS